ncbi:chitinase-like protein [Beauveria bassiana ARSEF 2860]|uniref:chitinase n=1 Tax=Beauveria bassiana (strain ARSEF 2860) TaxID=655819 RepID=J5J6A2_BEAB2|nr:chitinase-like protein [Beauveria bassiana ARSEF 2860]EJP62058.1 chitinase-like protein [Beauveria bassiana ARSEF 2860]
MSAFRLLWLQAAVAAIGILPVEGQTRQAASPGYIGRDSACPTRCSVSGPNPAKWPMYHHFEQFHSCKETLFYQFALYDAVDDPDTNHHIYACSSYGPDWENLAKFPNIQPLVSNANATYEIGWDSDEGGGVACELRSLLSQTHQYLSSGYATNNERAAFLYGQTGKALIGLRIGKGLESARVGALALTMLQEHLANTDVAASTLAIQLCQSTYGRDHTFGLVVTSRGGFSSVQEKLRSWENGQCVQLSHSKRITGPAYFTTPLEQALNYTNTTGSWNQTTLRGVKVANRATGECRTVQVKYLEGCPELAVKCGVSGYDFERYNPGNDFCSTLVPGQHVCCSAGELPDYRPKPNPDGSCKSWPVHGGDTCASIAAENGITMEEIVVFNENTWGWNGCGSNMWEGTLICLTKGTPPMPAPIANTVCGPQVPGTRPPTDGTDLSKLNPCPLNACCDVWGQCGTTAEFCIDTSTGAPGTAKKGTNGCISNCGTDLARGDAPETFRKIGYFEGYNLARKCLNVDARLIDTSQYTHLHFGFGSISADYEIDMPDKLTEYEFESFKRLTGVKRILSFGGWEFSTSPSTYNIFRQGVTPANRLKLATNIANYIKKHRLDGVDIDWEYPSAPDIPNIPAGDKSEGYNYLAFLAVLKNLLPGRSVSIAAPASYWYLKGFPIAQMSKIIDYIVYMTYDLHGQNQWSQPGCPSGMCLRSAVNLTETVEALVMITKAGVPSNKVVVGVTSYGRSFGMAKAGCYGPDCFYTGGPADSHAKKGECTDTAGYISDAEIKAIINTPERVNHNFLDGTSNSNILVYDDTEWVSWMSPEVLNYRTKVYKAFNMGGTSNWAIDLENYVDPPPGIGSWPAFVIKARQGNDPWDYGERHGNWTEIKCDDRSVADLRGLSPQSRWNMMDASDAWNDAVQVYKSIDRKRNRIFSRSISDTIHGPQQSDCGVLLTWNNCETIQLCTDMVGSGTGPAGYEIWNSFVLIREIYSSFYNALTAAGGTSITGEMAAFVKTFAPVPPPKDDSLWLNILMDAVGLGSTLVAGPFFNSANAATAANLKDTTMAMISGTTNIAKDLLAGKSPESNWTEDKQDLFAAYMAQTVDLWGASIEGSLYWLFNGTDEAISALTEIISDGKLIAGANMNVPGPKDILQGSASDMKTNMARAFFSYAIPAVWTASGHHPFVVDSGYACGTIDPLGIYMTVDTMSKTWGCYEDKLYYLVVPEGDAYKNVQNPTGPGTHKEKNKFSPPAGVQSLGGDLFGGVTLSDLITGSVRTYKNNGNTNGAPPADPRHINAEDLMKQDVTTPGFIRLPVCSPEMAFRAWDGPGGDSRLKTPNYPCVALKLPDRCGDSTFVDQTSGASPLVSDCEMIIKNLQNGDGHADHEVENAIGKQHQLDQYGSCKFGVQGKGKNGNIDFHVGGQDIVDLIRDSIDRFGGSGRVGAKGRMKCDGTVKKQDVEWGLY